MARRKDELTPNPYIPNTVSIKYDKDMVVISWKLKTGVNSTIFRKYGQFPGGNR